MFKKDVKLFFLSLWICSREKEFLHCYYYCSFINVYSEFAGLTLKYHSFENVKEKQDDTTRLSICWQAFLLLKIRITDKNSIKKTYLCTQKCKKMVDKQLKPDFIFEASWEVCNKVGGIYTVLSSRAQTLLKEYGDKLIFLGPDVWQEKNNPDFLEDKKLLKNWREAAAKDGVNVRIGRWQVAGRPIAVLVDFQPFFEQRNSIYGTAWQNFGVQSDKAYDDYD